MTTLIPKIVLSVIIPTCNGREQIELLLESLCAQSVNDFEVLVVDDGSTDGTRRAVEHRLAQYPVPLRYYYLDHKEIFGAGIARNHGAAHADGEILLFLDQDVVAAPDLIRNHIVHHKTKDVVLGYYAGYGDEGVAYGRSQLEEFVRDKKTIPTIPEFRDRLFHAAGAQDAWKCFVSAHFSIKKDLFEKFGFDESFIQWGCEDVDLGYRLFQAGVAVYFEKTCLVYNSSQSSRRSVKKFQTLSESLIQMYEKYQTDDMKLYCFERFYHTPWRYRRDLQLIFNEGRFTIGPSSTKIVLDKNCHALVILGPDLVDLTSTLEALASLITSVHFDVGVIKTLAKSSLPDFRRSFHRVIKVLRDKQVEINLDEIRRQSFLAGVRLIGPRRLGVCYYNHCNLECLFCSLNSPLKKNKKPLPQSLSASTVEHILEQAQEIGVDMIRLASDGEPLLSPDAAMILDSVARKGFEFHLLTNATTLKRAHLSALNNMHKRVNILINFSAATKATYQQIHGGAPDMYEAVVKSLSILSRLAQRKSVRGEILTLGTTFIITKLNWHELSDYIRLVKSLGVAHVYFKFAILYEEMEEILVEKSQIRELKRELLKAKLAAARIGLSTNIDEVLGNMGDQGFQNRNDIKEHSLNVPFGKCYNGWFFGRVNSCGNYYICCRETEPVGNLDRHSLKELFFSEEMDALLKEGAEGISLDKRMWRSCNYCYHIRDNIMAHKWLEQNEVACTCD